MRFPWSLCRFSFLLLAVLPVPARAAPAADAALANYLASTDGTPALMLRAPKDRVLLVMAGARYTRMTVQAASDVPVDTLRDDARRAASAAGLVGEMQVQRYPSFLRATVFERHPRPLSVSGENTVRYGAMAAALRSSGRQIQAAFRVLRTSRAALPEPLVTSDTFAAWYNIGAAPAGAVTKVHASLSPWMWTVALAFCLCGVFPLLTLARVIQVSLQRDRPPMERAYGLGWVPLVLVTAAGAQFLLLGALARRGAINVALDLWFASPGGMVVRNAIIGLVAAYGLACIAFFGIRFALERQAKRAPGVDGAVSAEA